LKNGSVRQSRYRRILTKAKRLNEPKTASNATGRRRRLLNPIQHKARATEDPGGSGNDVGRKLAALKLIERISAAIPGPAAGFTVDGEKQHDASGGVQNMQRRYSDCGRRSNQQSLWLKQLRRTGA
jgi:hypothetical protein